MDELKEKKLEILKGKIKEINEQESKEQQELPKPTKKMSKAKAAVVNQDREEQLALRRKKGMLVQLMYYINKRDFRLNNQR